jgi:hypothetical protein
MHKYLYAANNPVNMVDPSGHEYTIGNLLTTTAILTTLTTISGGAITYAAGKNAALDEDGKPDAAIISVSESLQTRGAGADFGFDIVYHFKSQRMYAYVVGSVGLAPLSYFKNFRNSHGPSFTAGFIWNMNSPEEWSGEGLTATWPLSVAHLLPRALFGGRNAIWGMMTQLAKREHNIRTSDIAVQVGISTSGPAFLKVGPRSNFFAAQAGLASQPIDLQAVGESLGDLLGDKLSTLPSLRDNPENVFEFTR